MSSKGSGRRGKGSCCQQVMSTKEWLLEKRRRWRGLGDRDEVRRAGAAGVMVEWGGGEVDAAALPKPGMFLLRASALVRETACCCLDRFADDAVAD